MRLLAVSLASAVVAGAAGAGGPDAALYSVRPDGKGRTNVSGAFGPVAAAIPSRDGRRVVLVRATLDYPLFVAEANGSNPRQIVGETASDYSLPMWSPDGTRIAFVRTDLSSCRPGATKCATWQIWTVGADGADERKLTDDGIDPAWSPDGRFIAYGGTIFNAEAYHVRVMSADGTRERTLAAGSRPVWSPDGRRLAYTMRSGFVALVGAGGTRRRAIARGVWPRWAPNGRSIVFTRLEARGHTSLWQIGADGRKLRRLTRADADAAFASWSPRGDRLALIYRPPDGVFQVYTLALADRRLRRVTREEHATFTSLFWSADGRRIFYVAQRTA